MIETAEAVIEAANQAAQQPPLWWLAVLILIGLFMLGVAVKFLLGRISKLERAAATAQKKAEEAASKTENFLREQLAERKEELADRKLELSKVVEALTNSTRIIEQNSRVLEECSMRIAVNRHQHDGGDARAPRPLLGL